MSIAINPSANPVSKVLGIPVRERPLNAYDILGLENLESDQGRIRTASSRQKLALESRRGKVSPDDWKSAEHSLQRAIDTLTSIDEKEILDASIRRQQRRQATRPQAGIVPGDTVECQCGRENPADRVFCSACGESLWTACIDCRTVCSTSVKFCGDCGVNLNDAVQKHVQRAEARLVEADGLLSEFRFDEAAKLLRAIAKHDDPRMEDLVQMALGKLEKVKQQRSSVSTDSAQALDAARHCIEQCEYDKAIEFLSNVHERLRDAQFREVLEEATDRKREVDELHADIRELLEAKRITELGSRLERYLKLKPNDKAMLRLTEQLRDALIRKAQAQMKVHHYEPALELIGHIPDCARNEAVEKLTQTVTELQCLMYSIRTSPVVNKTLLAVAERLCKLVPDNQDARKFHEQMKVRFKTVPKDPRAPFPAWVAPPKRDYLGFPLNWLGRLQSLAAAEDSTSGTMLAHEPGRFFVAAGLALQGLDAAAVSTNLMTNPPKKAASLFAFGKRKQTEESAWGLDISTTGLKAVKLVRTKEGLEISDTEEIKHRQAFCFLGVAAERTELIEETVKQFLERHPITTERVVVGLPAQRLLTRWFSVPPIADKKMRDAVQFEAKHQIPIPLSELAWSFHVQHHESLDNAKDTPRRVFLLAAKKHQILDLERLFETLELPIHGLQCDAVALHNAMVHEFDINAGSAALDKADEGTAAKKKEGPVAATEAHAFVDVGADATNLVVSWPGHVWLRSLTIGGDQFSRALVEQFQITSEQAEQLKRHPTKARLFSSVCNEWQPILDDLGSELQRSLAVFDKAFPEVTVTQMHGLGGGFAQHGLFRQLRMGPAENQ